METSEVKIEYFKDAHHSWIKTGINISKCSKCGIVKTIDRNCKYVFYRDSKIVENEGCSWYGTLIKDNDKSA